MEVIVKMFSKEGQILIDAKSLRREGDNLVMKGKLMDAYTMSIYLKPEEIWSMLDLLSWSVIRYLPVMLLRGWRSSRINSRNTK
jgi:hypothetical protein